jgi:AraC family transcriptional regulator
LGHAGIGVNKVAEIVRKALFASERLQIGSIRAQPTSEACGDVERQTSNAIVLPVSGVFAKHEAPGRYVIGTPSHAVLFATGAPYRIGFPGAIGDRALVLRFDDNLVWEHLDKRAGSGPLLSQGLLPPDAMLLRNLLWARLQGAPADEFASEALGLDLLCLCLRSMHTDCTLPPRRSALARNRRAVERVKEAVASAPAERWTVAKLAHVANLSPFQLAHVFPQLVGTSLYDYVLHERLAQTIDAVLNGGDLTAIALDAGFASHSHFTAHFRRFFGCTPTMLRRSRSREAAAQSRKIVTARRGQFD